ncbi:MAG: peptidase M22 [Ruminococcus sp.]|nr:peptidase M22 [Ruminococcus sp.]
MYYLGIDTSNYTTSVALIDENKEIIQQKKLLPVKSGEIGLRQSDAVFHHTAQLHSLYTDLVKNINPAEIKAIGVSTRPRNVEGSYMPCFTVGHNAAKIISATLNVPLYAFSHQEGHIAAAIFSTEQEKFFSEKFIAFHVSGGTTEAVLAKPDNFGFKLDIIAKTLDLNAGQAIDRVGVMLGLGFPCGKELEKLALNYKGVLKVKKSTLKNENCCLSGIENICNDLYKNNSSKEYIAAYCLKYIENTLSLMTDKLLKKYGNLPLLYAGGVMSNSIIRKSFESKYNAYFAAPEFSADNAAGIAYLTYRKAIYDKS